MSVSSGLGSIIGGTVSGLTGLVGGAMTNSANADNTSNANSAAVANQVQAENYDTQMSNTQYQRGVSDMRSAGLNPILAAGSPDSAPTISAAPVSTPDVVNTLGNAGSAFNQGFSTTNSALNQDTQTDSSVALQSAQQAQIQANIANTNADTASTLAGLPSKQLENAGAKAITPLVNSAISAGQDASSMLVNSFKSVSQAAADDWAKPMPSLSRFGQIMKELVSPSGSYSGTPPLSDGISISGSAQPYPVQ